LHIAIPAHWRFLFLTCPAGKFALISIPTNAILIPPEKSRLLLAGLFQPKTYSSRVRKMETPVKRIELHIVIGCADARDISAAFNDALNAQKAQEAVNSTFIDFQRMSVAGTFMTPEIIAELKAHIQEKMQEYYKYYRQSLSIEIFIHVTAHGNGVLKEGCNHSRKTYHDIKIEDSAFNCGMMHAQDVAMEMEEMLLANKAMLEYGLKGKRTQIRIETEEDIETLMKRAYGHNGTIAGNWVKSIVNLCTHPYEQKKVLRQALDADPTFANLRIRITAGVQNYQTSDYFRVDGNTHLDTFLDKVYQRVRKDGQPDMVARISKQKPVLGLFHHSSISQSRATAVKNYFGNEKYSAGQVFAIGSMNLRDYFRTFGPYKSAGFFYGVKHLGLLNWVVMGRTLDEAEEMRERILSDPLMSYFVREFKVRLVAMDTNGQRLSS
jgi:hypothetical protein